MTTAARIAPAKRQGKAASRTRKTVLHIVLVVAGLAMVFPFIWMLLTSFKTLPQLLNDPLSFLP
jgi:multiple sugar transport system permease protein